MKKTIIATTFVAFGLVTAGAGAAITLKGSDTIKDLTIALIPACTGAAGQITYTGGGSGGGEQAAGNGSQQTAPMSRFLANNANVCGFAPDASEAEGIAFAADGLSFLMSEVHHSACDPGTLPSASPAPDCDAATFPNTGLKKSGTLPISGYVVNNWKDVLRILYFGVSGTASNPAASTRSCNSAIRKELVNTWGNLFENGCAPGSTLCPTFDHDANPATPATPGLRHAFRRDENSGTTDVFRELLLLNSGSNTGNNGFPFCNEYVPSSSDPAPACAPSTVTASITGGTGLPMRPYFELYQDSDPIRRTTVGTGNLPFTPGGAPNTNATEQVSGLRGDLGVVLPISPPQAVPDADRYPTQYCSLGVTTTAAAPIIAANFNCPSLGTSGPIYALCPNGDMPTGAQWCPEARVALGGIGQCIYPATQGGDVRCINGKNNNITLFNPPPDTACVVATSAGDGRVYNLHPHKQDGSYVTQSYAVNDLGLPGPTSVPTGSQNRIVVGAFYRIHTTRTAAVATNATCPGDSCCKRDDATVQIGCVVEANPCSLGFAGREGDLVELNTTGGVLTGYANAVNAVGPLSQCLEGAQYPMSRLLYDNTITGFRTTSPAGFPSAVNGAELSLAQCYSGNNLIAPATLNGLITTYNFVPLASGPHCEDFKESTCGDATNSNACANNPAGIAP